MSAVYDKQIHVVQIASSFMQRPSHPNNPGNYNNVVQHAAFAAQAMTAALQNPYNNNFYGQPYGYASHYAQAYAQAGPSSSAALTTSEGYTISSTYVPELAPFSRGTGRGRGFQRGRGNSPTTGPPRSNFQARSSWYEPGNTTCSREGCPFSGSKKSVEIHMMDRHFIFPTDWEKRKRKDEWDADPSLKG